MEGGEWSNAMKAEARFDLIGELCLAV